jgi:hypothetical protein
MCIPNLVWLVGLNKHPNVQDYFKYSGSERMEQFRYLGTTLTNQNSFHKEIKSKMKSGDACYLLVRNLLSSTLLL